jgi:rubrerythrin
MTSEPSELLFKKKRKEAKKKRAYELLQNNEKQAAIAPSVIIKEKEITTEVMINCTYCGALMKITSTHCPDCGAPRKH